MRFLEPPEETPAWAASRAVQAFYLFSMVFLVAGVVASFTVRVEYPWMRPLIVALAVIGELVILAALIRSARARRSRDETDAFRGDPPG